MTTGYLFDYDDGHGYDGREKDKVRMIHEQRPDGRYKLTNVGEIVYIDEQLDVAIFKFNELVKVAPWEIAISNVRTCTISYEDLIKSKDPQCGGRLAVFGSSRRGMVGKIDERIHSESLNKLPSSMRHCARTEHEQVPLTEAGDCGAVYFDENGSPLYVHNMIEEPLTKGGGYASVGIPLRTIVQGCKFIFLVIHDANTATKILLVASLTIM